MNMKKSIAGVMAGALAVSAIATTASAWTGGSADQEQIVLSYDLNEKLETISDSEVRIKFEHLARTDNPYIVKGLTKGGSVDVTVGAKLKTYDYYALKQVNIHGVSTAQIDDNSTSTNPVTRVNPVDKKFASAVVVNTDTKLASDVMIVPAVKTGWDGVNVCSYTIPFTANGSNLNNVPMDGCIVNGTLTPADYALVAGGTATSYTSEAAAKAAVDKHFNKVVADPANKSEYSWTVSTLGTDATAATPTDVATGLTEAAANAVKGTYTVKDPKEAAIGDVIAVTTLGTAGASDWKVTVTTAATAGVKPVTTEKKETVKAVADAQYAADVANASLKVTSDIKVTDDKDNKYYLTDESGVYTKGVYEWKEAEKTGNTYGFNSFDVELVFTANAKDWEWNDRVKDEAWAIERVTNGAIDGLLDANYNVTKLDGSHGDYFKPMRTDWNAPAEVVDRLTKLGYTYPQAVLNDVIANNENVAFTFTTCQSFVDTRQWVKPERVVDGSKAGLYIAAVKNPRDGVSTHKDLNGITKAGTVYVENPYYGVAYPGNKKDDYLDKDNMLWHNPVFSQSLYQEFTWSGWGGKGYTASGPNGSQGSKDQFGSYASIWNTNLNSAGLVANSRWTMQLSDVDAFEWGDSTITFFWDAITDEANITNAANFLQTLQLYTPNEWFWDKMDVAVGAAIAENVGADAPLTEEAEEVTEAETEEEVIEEEEPVEEEEPIDDDFEEEEEFTEEEEEFTEEEEEEEITEEVTEPVQEAPETVEVDSPKTGNAPVALAVIPVALAAAAVVAKKRK